MTDSRLPDDCPPEDFEASHGRRLARLIRQEAAGGSGLLSFDRFMELALYAPGLGYYVAGAQKFGPAGDFVTAPEISPIFGRCIARQCREVLAGLDGGDVLELGAGSGVLAADLLAGLQTDGALPARYLILELSPDLRERQQSLLAARLPGLLDRIHWLDALPRGFEGFIVANEVADAMPVHRFLVLEDGSAAEIMVRPAGDAWEEVAVEPVSPGLSDAIVDLQVRGLATAPGYGSEINLRLAPWASALAGAMDKGMALFIDYGYPRAEYYHPDRTMGTLVCNYRHRAHDNPYRYIGTQDITAHVDFSALAEAGVNAGFELAGFTTQAHFLIGCGLDELLAQAAEDGDMELLLGVKQLVLPTGMGERFRVLGLTRGLDRDWCGFSIRDLSGRL